MNYADCSGACPFFIRCTQKKQKRPVEDLGKGFKRVFEGVVCIIESTELA